MELIQAQVLSVTGKNTSKGVIYEVQMGNGTTYSTWDGNIAAKANGLQGQLADANVELKTNTRNGRTYNNYTLLDIAAQGQFGAVAQPVAPGVPVAPANTNAIPMQAPDVRIPDVERNRMIVRQNVLGTSFAFIASLYEGAGPEALEAAEAAAFGLASKLYTKVMAKTGSEPASDPVQLPPDATPTDVAEAVNAASATGAEVAVGAQAEFSEW